MPGLWYQCSTREVTHESLTSHKSGIELVAHKYITDNSADVMMGYFCHNKIQQGYDSRYSAEYLLQDDASNFLALGSNINTVVKPCNTCSASLRQGSVAHLTCCTIQQML